jgi:hypothetical protein
MGSIMIVDNCLAPEKDIFLKYSGPEPWSIVKKISKTIKPFFHVSSSGTGWTRLNWDRTGDNIEFFALWWVKKGPSRFSEMRFDLKVQGAENKNTKMGDFNIRLTAHLNTNFTGWGIFLKPIWYLYSYIFYDKARRRYIENCREYLLGFYNELKEQFNIQSTTFGPAQASLG